MNHYINLGRWADNIIGPFDTFEEADEYIDTIDWRGSRPTVVTVEKPKVQYNTYTIQWSYLGWYHSTDVWASSDALAGRLVLPNLPTGSYIVRTTKKEN